MVYRIYLRAVELESVNQEEIKVYEVIKGEKSGKNSETGETSVSKPVSNRHVGRPSKSRSFSNQKADEFLKHLKQLEGKVY